MEITSARASSSSSELVASGCVGVVGEHLHAQAAQAPAQRPPHRTQTHQPHRLPRQLPGPVALVRDLPVAVDLPLPHVAVRRHDAPGRSEQQCHRQFGHRVRVAPRGAEHGNAGGGGGRHVDVGRVAAAAAHGDDGLLVELGAADIALDDHDRGTLRRHAFGQLDGVVDAQRGLIEPGIEHEICQLVQQIETGTADGGSHQGLRAGACHVGGPLLSWRMSSIMTPLHTCPPPPPTCIYRRSCPQT